MTPDFFQENVFHSMSSEQGCKLRNWYETFVRRIKRKSRATKFLSSTRNNFSCLCMPTIVTLQLVHLLSISHVSNGYF